MEPTTLLIVEQQPRAPDNLPALLKELSQRFQLDLFQCRQRLVGKGLSLLSKGVRSALEKISDLLREYGYRHWLVEPSTPKYVPSRLRGLQIGADKITFICQNKRVEFPKGARILAVFAEMSGALAEQSVKQMLSSYAYRGRDNVRPLAAQKTYKTILQGEPLLDLYLLDDQGQIVDAVRVFPGKFDHRGLGERATASSRQNLDQIIKLAKEYAGAFTLQTDFGLVNLPGCTLRRENPGDPETQRRNQLSLARYGWLLADLQRVGPIDPPPKEGADNLTASIAAAIVTRNPNLATGNQGELLTAAKSLADDIRTAEKDPESQILQPVPDNPGLPAPPAARNDGMWKHPGYWLGSAGAVIAFVCFLLADTDIRLPVKLFHYCFDAGVTQLILSALLFWGGFYFLLLKRQVENTPTSKVRSIAMGMVEVKGRAIRQYALVSPMSYAPCVFYRLTKYHRGKNQEWLISSVSSSDNVPFYLEDETGRVSVDPSSCRVNAGSKQEGIPGQFGLMHQNFDSDVKWVEEFIAEGTHIYVLGFASVKRNPGPSMNERRIAALRELKRNPQSLQQYDADGDGKISEAEWDSAREAVEEQLLEQSLHENQKRKKQEEQVVIGKKKGRPFIIAETQAEENLTGRYAFYIPALFVGAAIFVGWGIRALLN